MLDYPLRGSARQPTRTGNVVTEKSVTFLRGCDVRHNLLSSGGRPLPPERAGLRTGGFLAAKLASRVAERASALV